MTARRGTRHLAQPRPQGRRVEQVAGVEQRGQQDDRRARPGRSPRSRRPRTGRPRRRRSCSSPGPRWARSRPRARPGRRRTRTRSHRDGEPAVGIGRRRARRRLRRPGSPRRRSAQEGLAAGPVADDEHGVLLARVAGRVEQPRAARGRAFPDPPALVGVERVSSRPSSLAARSSWAATRAAIPRRAPPRSRSCRGSSGRRSRSRARVSHSGRGAAGLAGAGLPRRSRAPGRAGATAG